MLQTLSQMGDYGILANHLEKRLQTRCVAIYLLDYKQIHKVINSTLL